MEISRTLTISTVHIKKETMQELRRINEEQKYVLDYRFPAFYTKGEYGFLIYVPENILDTDTEGKNTAYPQVPEDLVKAMQLAREHGCEWLCLDDNGEEVEELERYNW